MDREPCYELELVKVEVENNHLIQYIMVKKWFQQTLINFGGNLPRVNVYNDHCYGAVSFEHTKTFLKGIVRNGGFLTNGVRTKECSRLIIQKTRKYSIQNISLEVLQKYSENKSYNISHLYPRSLKCKYIVMNNLVSNQCSDKSVLENTITHTYASTFLSIWNVAFHRAHWIEHSDYI